MKKIIFSLLAAAALAACTKTDVTYDAPAEIGFAPVTKSITKAAMPSGNLDANQKLNVWALWDADGAVESNATYANYTDAFLENALFAKRQDQNWGGDGAVYPWPTNGALVFSGYTTPTSIETSGTGYNVSYALTDDKMVFTNYTQSTSTESAFDLCWFNRTAASYNNRASGAAVPVTLSHALTWITINAYGSGTPVNSGNEWKIKSIVLKDVVTVGTGTCVGTGAGKATWTLTDTKSNITIWSATDDKPGTLSGTSASFETTKDGTVVIPQKPVKMAVTFEYPVGNSTREETVEIDLTLSGHKDADDNNITSTIQTWSSGTHYTYTLLFKGNEILVAPSYGDWATANQTVTVE